jgi:hypothetical protein
MPKAQANIRTMAEKDFVDVAPLMFNLTAGYPS